ncbi:MAG: cysteine synthase A [Deltaproteobacteria bacterium]|nr:cysteine synthase A [Deltaproteobacteria bacterium]
MPRIGKNILDLVFNTPMVHIQRLVSDNAAELWGKMESENPAGSVKDRIGLNMILDGEQRGLITPETVIIEPTSGNTGIGLAMTCAARGYRLILTMPETMSQERKLMLRAFGAELVLTPGPKGMRGAIERATELAEKESKVFMPQQFKNPANPEVHRRTTGPEILEALGGVPDVFIAGVGTGGTITGVGEVLKKENPKARVIAIEPTESPVLSGGKPGPHKIQGIGAGFVPEILNRDVIDEVIQVSYEEAKKVSRALAEKEGIFVGISSGAAIHASIAIAEQLGKGKRIVTILPSTGERYLSTGLFDPM